MTVSSIAAQSVEQLGSPCSVLVRQRRDHAVPVAGTVEHLPPLRRGEDPATAADRPVRR